MTHKNFKKLIETVKALRDPRKGCPWDLKQTHRSLLKFLIEECYEYIYAVENEDFSQMEEELGDVLLQVLLHCKIAEENNNFTLESISKTLDDKLTRRHPHVFSSFNPSLKADEVVVNWNKIKKMEKEENEQFKHRIDETDLIFPALFSANKIGEKTNQLGFDWDNARQVATKVEEEWQELKDEIALSTHHKRIEEELGDLLFSMAQLARHLGCDPENALRMANKKFISRFNKMELLMEKDDIILENLDQEDMDQYWDIVKKKESKDKGQNE